MTLPSCWRRRLVFPVVVMLVMLPGSGFFTSSHTGGAFLHQTDFGQPVVVVIEEEEGKVV